MNEEVGEQILHELRAALRQCGIVLPDSANLNGGVENFLRMLIVACLNAGDPDSYQSGGKLPDDVSVAPGALVMMSLDGNGNPQPAQRTKDSATVADFFKTLRR